MGEKATNSGSGDGNMEHPSERIALTSCPPPKGPKYQNMGFCLDSALELVDMVLGR